MPFSRDLEKYLTFTDAALYELGIPLAQIHAIQDEQKRRAALHSQWLSNCPPALRNTDWTRCELAPYRLAIDAALAWRPGQNGKPGLLMVGVPGSGKTRCLMALAHRLLVEANQAVCGPFAAKGLADEGIAAERGGCLSAWAAGKSRLPLLIDDLGQERSPWPSTDVWIVAMWRQLLDGLIGNGVPLVATSNFHSTDWAARAPAGCLGDAVARRLADHCTILDFSQSTV